MPTPSERAALRLTFQLDLLNAALARHARVTRTEFAVAVKKTAFQLERMIKQRTPVDTGRLRASIHTVTYGSASAFSYSAPGRRGQPARSFDGTLQDTPASELQAIVGTNVEYALPIEAGHSRKAPAGMFRISVAELRETFRAEIKSVLQRHRQLGR